MSLRTFILLILLVVTLLALAIVPTRTPQQMPAPSEWQHRRPVVITNAGEADLRDFQVRLALDAGNFDFDLTQSNGSDLRFADEDGQRYLPHWVERYDAEARQATVWVKVPYIPASGRRTIYLYYDNPAADNLSSGGRTFEKFDDFGQPGLGYYAFGPPATVMTRTEAWETEAPHTLSVIEWNRDGYRYWGYYGLADCGGIGLARSNDLINWVKAPEPLLNRDGERWPSVQRVRPAEERQRRPSAPVEPRQERPQGRVARIHEQPALARVEGAGELAGHLVDLREIQEEVRGRLLAAGSDLARAHGLARGAFREGHAQPVEGEVAHLWATNAAPPLGLDRGVEQRLGLRGIPFGEGCETLSKEILC